MGSGSRVHGPLYQKALDKIYSGVKGPNRRVIEDFLERYCVKRGLSEARKVKYVSLIQKVLVNQKDLRKFGQEDAESFFYWLQQTRRYTDDTKKDFWNQFRLLP